MPIRRLSPLLVNQIAAGEVIERPASVVKELVENAIDACADRIEVVIEEGGRELIRVSDNGNGIPPEEIILALAPHATSKITAAEDLNAIATMGFRGEALASIASVSRMTLISRPESLPAAAMLESAGEHLGVVTPAGGPPGTTVTVKTLFFNTPARRKFLRTAATETSRISDVVESLALAQPAIGFSLTSGRRRLFEYRRDSTPRERVFDVLGADLREQLLEIDVDERGIGIWGMIGRPSIARSHAKFLRLYLNGRPIRDRSLHHACKEAYRGLIEHARHPMLVLFLEMDPSQVDVNVHPAKAEVRFRNQAQLHGLMLSTLRNRLRAADLTPALNISSRGTLLATPIQPRPEFGSGLPPSPTGDPSLAGAGQGMSASTDAARFVEYFQRLDPRQKGFVYREVKEALGDVGGLHDVDVPDRDESARVTPGGPGVMSAPDEIPAVRIAPEILQIHSSYIVTQDEHGIVIIDQHALHERVMFELLKDRLGTGTLESQRLLMPETIEVDRTQVDLLESIRPLLQRIGIEAEPMGPTTIAVHAFPSFLFERHVAIRPFMTELLDKALAGGLAAPDEGSEAALHEVLDMMACKAAVKAGDRLSQDELTELLKYRESIERTSNCPHGRPTTLRLSIEQLDKQFGRS